MSIHKLSTYSQGLPNISICADMRPEMGADSYPEDGRRSRISCPAPLTLPVIMRKIKKYNKIKSHKIPTREFQSTVG